MSEPWYKSSIFIIVTPLVFLAIITIVIHNTLFSGILIGEFEGKVRSTYYKQYSGFRGSTSVQMAKVNIKSGGQVSIICESYCTIDLEVKVSRYKSIFSDKEVLIYD